MAGFAVRLAYQANEGKTTSLNPYNQGASLTYNKGPLYAFYAYENHKDVSATLRKEEGNSIGGAYTIGAVKVGALAQEFKKTGLTKKKTMMANATYTMGKHQFIYQYTDTKDGAADGTTQPDCDVNALGYQNNFTRRTFLLVQYTKVKNNSTSACRAGSFVSGNDSDPEGFSVGLRHVF